MKQLCCQTNSVRNQAIVNLSAFTKLIHEPNRLKILCLLKQGELCVCEIFEALNLPQNLVSHHLKVLKKQKLIGSKKQATKVIYFRKESVIKKYANLLNKII